MVCFYGSTDKENFLIDDKNSGLWVAIVVGFCYRFGLNAEVKYGIYWFFAYSCPVKSFR